LTPTVRGSDRTVRHGHISKQGSAWLRWILCEAAQTAKRHPDFAATYAAMARRRGKKIATTAIARKLLTRAFHLLIDVDAGADTAAAPARRRGKKAGSTARSASTTPVKTTTANNTSTTSPSGTRRTRAQTGTVASPGRARVSA
jgi:hypothetical protein